VFTGIFLKQVNTILTVSHNDGEHFELLSLNVPVKEHILLRQNKSKALYIAQ